MCKGTVCWFFDYFPHMLISKKFTIKLPFLISLFKRARNEAGGDLRCWKRSKQLDIWREEMFIWEYEEVNQLSAVGCYFALGKWERGERKTGRRYLHIYKTYLRGKTIYIIYNHTNTYRKGRKKSITCVNALLQGEKPPALFTVIQTYIHSGKIVLKHTSLHFHRATFTQEVHEEMSRTLACRACPCRIQMHPWYAIGNAISERNNYSSKRLCYERSLRTMLFLCARH